MALAEHTEDGVCWCEVDESRERALDRLIPDRCQLRWTPDPAASRAPAHCVLPLGHPSPCLGGLEPVGGPCHFCGAAFSGDACPICWSTFEGMSLADIRAEFAASADDLSIDPTVG